MPTYVLSSAAQKSLSNIHHYSLNNFGNQRTVTYIKTLRDSMRELSKKPTLGQTRNDLKAGYFSYFVDSHTIYYKTSETGIAIIDVLHQSMEPSLHI